MGWETSFIAVIKGDNLACGALMLSRAIPILKRSICVIPCGPWWAEGAQDRLGELFDGVAGVAGSHGAISCRFHFACSEEHRPQAPIGLTADLRTLPHVWSYWNLARPIMKWCLSDGFEKVVSRISTATRKNYRRSMRSGLRISQAGPEDIHVLARLMAEMGDRKGILVQDQDYFSNVFEAYGAGKVLYLLAENSGVAVGASMGIIFGQTCYELYRAVNPQFRYEYPDTALVVEMAKRAIARNCSVMDMGGTCTGWPPSEQDKGYGIYEFKKRLGAEAVLTSPYQDIVYHKLQYSMLGFIENVMMPLWIEKGFGKVEVVRNCLAMYRGHPRS